MTTDKLIRPSVASTLFNIKATTLRDLAIAGYIIAYNADGSKVDIATLEEGYTTDRFSYRMGDLEEFFSRKVDIKVA